MIQHPTKKPVYRLIQKIRDISISFKRGNKVASLLKNIEDIVRQQLYQFSTNMNEQTGISISIQDHTLNSVWEPFYKLLCLSTIAVKSDGETINFEEWVIPVYDLPIFIEWWEQQLGYTSNILMAMDLTFTVTVNFVNQDTRNIRGYPGLIIKNVRFIIKSVFKRKDIEYGV